LLFSFDNNHLDSADALYTFLSTVPFWNGTPTPLGGPVRHLVRSLFPLFLVASAVLILASIASAQITNVTADQAPPTPGVGHDYIHLVNETVNPATGSVSIRISVPLPPGRDTTIPFSFGYDSNSAFHKSGPATYADNTGYLGKA
jgi:hypothetical protein